MTNWSARDLTLQLDFLDEGAYQATICKDGVNADRYAAGYSLKKNIFVKKMTPSSFIWRPAEVWSFGLKKLQTD